MFGFLRPRYLRVRLPGHPRKTKRHVPTGTSRQFLWLNCCHRFRSTDCRAISQLQLWSKPKQLLIYRNLRQNSNYNQSSKRYCVKKKKKIRTGFWGIPSSEERNKDKLSGERSLFLQMVTHCFQYFLVLLMNNCYLRKVVTITLYLTKPFPSSKWKLWVDPFPVFNYVLF